MLEEVLVLSDREEVPLAIRSISHNYRNDNSAASGKLAAYESVAGMVVQMIWYVWVVQSKVLNSAAYESVVMGGGGSTNDKISKNN